MSLPSGVAPRATRCTVRGRWPVVKNICLRVSTSLTGRPTWRAAMAASVTCGQVLRLVPKAPPMNGQITCTFSAGRPKMAAISACSLTTILALAPQRQPVAVPGRDGRVRLHRIVVLARDVVGRVDLHGRARQSAIGVAAPLVRVRCASGFRNDGLCLRVGRIDDRPLGRIGDAQRRGGALGMVERVGDDDRNGLAVEADLIVLQHVQPLADGRVDRSPCAARRQAGRVEVADHRDDAGHALDRRRCRSPVTRPRPTVALTITA